MVEKKKYSSVIIMAGLLIAMYAGSSAVIRYVSRRTGETYERSRQGTEEEYQSVELIPLEFDPAEYLQVLLSSDYLGDLLQNALDDFDLDISPEDFLNLFGDDLEDIFNSFSGEGFDPSMFDDIPSEYLGAVLSLPMYYFYETNTGVNPMNNPEDVFFKTATYDKYDTQTFKWVRSSGMDYLSNLFMEDGRGPEEFGRIKYPVVLNPKVSQYLPFAGPDGRLINDLISSSPSPSSMNMREQLYLDGVIYTADYDSSYEGDNTNVSYYFNYNSELYDSGIHIGEGSLTPFDYSGSNNVVLASLKAPDGASSWDNFRVSNPYFDDVILELESYSEYQDAQTSYEIMDAILNYIGGNFTLNINSQNTPSEGRDPIDHFCQYKESNRVFDFSALTTVLARYSGIPTRYVSGYRWNNALESYFGGSYNDPMESGDEVYVYRIAHGYSWVEAFLPESENNGTWVTFDNRFTSDYSPPPLGEGGDSFLNIEIDSGSGFNYYAEPLGYERYTGPTPTELTLRTELVFNNNPQNGINITIYDTTYDNKVIGSALTNSEGISTFDFDILDWVSGPHILNFTINIGDDSFAGNATIINVLGDVELNLKNGVEPTTIYTNANTEINTTGYLWDPIIQAPVRNGYVNMTYHELFNPPPQDFSPFKNAVSDENGNFTIIADVSGFPQNNYSIYVTFNGTFYLGDHLAPIFSQYSQASAYLPVNYPAHLINGYIDGIMDQIEVIDPTLVEAFYWINGTQSGDYSATGGSPLIVNRGSGYLKFNATTWHSTGWTSGQIEVRDLTEGNRLVTTFNTNPSTGYGENLVFTGGINPSNLTVGPHLLRFIWTDCPNPGSFFAQSDIWIFVYDNIGIQLTSNYYVEGSGSTSNNYSIDIAGGGDNFNISGYVLDLATNERVRDTVIRYTVQDKFSNPQDLYLSGSGNLEQVTNNPQAEFYKDFVFVGTTPLSAAPIRTRADFLGHWINLGNGWDNNWNDAWQGLFFGVFDISDGDIYLNDPTESDFKTFVNNQPFLDIYNQFDIPVFNVGDNINFSCTFIRAGSPEDAANVSLYMVLAGSQSLIASGSTDIYGNASFIYSFTTSQSTGLYKFRLHLSFTDGVTITKTADAWVLYNRSIGDSVAMKNEGRNNWNINLTRGEGDTLRILGEFNDINENGLRFAQFNAWALYNGVSYPIGMYFNVENSNYNEQNGEWFVDLSAKSDAMTGNWSFILAYEGNFNIPGGLNNSPMVYYSAYGLIQNSTEVDFTVVNSPILTSNWVTPGFETTSQWIIGGTLLDINGTLTYDNGTVIIGAQVEIKIYSSLDSEIPIHSINATTNSTGGFGIDNYLIEVPLEFYTIEYLGDSMIYTEPSGLITKYF